MRLVIGGAASGKLTFVHTLGYSDEQLADAVLDECPVLYNLQDLIGTQLAAGSDPIATLLDPLLTKEVVVCDEVGAGVIPANAQERTTRETTGRICNILAQQATSVVRLVAGIPIVIK